MITLITGTPGAGKTAFALDMMVRQGRLDNSRKLYVHGIPELKVPHEIVVCESSSCDYCSTLPLRELPDAALLENPVDIENYSYHGYLKCDRWHEYAEKGGILFFDEVQNIHRPRHASAPVPPSVAAYEVHRHRGLDFFIITQNPALIDSNVRQLVSRHIHLTSSWARRIQYEFPQCKTDLGATVGEGIKSNYTLPKDVFSLYKSASLHTKVERKKPLVIYLIPFVLLLIAGLVYFEYNKFKNKAGIASASSTVEKNKDVSIGGVNPAAAGGGETRGAQATHGYTPPAAGLAVNFSQQQDRIILDMPRLFKTWSQVGIADDDLKFLPISMCSVSSARFVKCKFPVRLSFKNFFSNISCTPEFCFAFLNRIPAVIENQRNFTTPPPLVPPMPLASPISTIAAN